MAIEFLLGPAGSGKTYACLTQVREALSQLPDGPPLLWIAPKQSTFQLERDLLANGVRGFTRLQIQPFDRVARWVLQHLGVSAREVLSEEGRVMVLHSLLLARQTDLESYGRVARTPGFARQLSRVLREFQQNRIPPDRLRALALPEGADASLTGKLKDLALLLEAYSTWLQEHQLRDPDDLLTLAAEELSRARVEGRPLPPCGGLWLDGFAEMTVPEMDLLVALLPGCPRATLAFCLEGDPADRGGADGAAGEPATPSLWSVTSATYLRCRDRIAALAAARSEGGEPVLGVGAPGTGKGESRKLDDPLSVRVRCLPETGAPTRFSHSEPLARLARDWERPGGASAFEGLPRDGIGLVECADPESEAWLAVRLIHRHVRDFGGRYRDVSVIVRQMDGYGEVVQRAFRRHGIPYFADHREPMGHHPVAELTRSALRLAANGWGHEDWLAALKTGLVVDAPDMVDRLENRALARGVRGDGWLRLEEYGELLEIPESGRALLRGPLGALAGWRSDLARPVTGAELGAALRRLWASLRVPDALAGWQAQGENLPPKYRAIHHTAWEQILGWCDALELAFATTTLSPRDWVSIAEAGLSGLSLGVIPPALDQVLIGAIDRARQPEVTLTLVLGLNEGVFPAAPAAPALLNRSERQWLSEGGLDLGWAPLQQAAREDYYAHIACTRPSRRLCASWSRRGLDGRTQVRSSAAERLLTLMGQRPDAPASAGDALSLDGVLKAFHGNPTPASAVTWSEWFECAEWDRVAVPETPQGRRLQVEAEAVAQLRRELTPEAGEAGRRLLPEAVARLAPDGLLVSSVSALEDFAECPFRHFAQRQLRLKERDEFEADPKSTGSLLHAVLRSFHEVAVAGGRRWRDWSSGAARAEVLRLGEVRLTEAEFAPLVKDPLVAWETRRRLQGVADLVAQTVAWMATNSFDPVLAEFRFGSSGEGEVPAWVIDLGNGRRLALRGSIDRVDAHRAADGRVWLAVMDYKSSAQTPAPAEMEHGFELQLLAYLAYATGSAELRAHLPGACAGAEHVQPAGAFYVPLQPKVPSVGQEGTAEDVERAYLESMVHAGRATLDALNLFDASATEGPRGPRSGQFKPSQFLPAVAFRDLLANTVAKLRQHALAILDGRIGAHPVRYGAARTACDLCSYRPVCRFEPISGQFRSVPAVSPKASPTATENEHQEPACPPA